MNERILVAEDDLAILTALVDLLTLEGYSVTSAPDGLTALERYRGIKHDLLLLDVMMPHMSGYDVCRAIRRDDLSTPILMLTAKGEEVDKVVGLELGADDYIVKPFGMSELLARIRAALRRGALLKEKAQEPEMPSCMQIGDVSIDFESMTGHRGNASFSLTPKETALLRLFAVNEGKVISRETLLELVWGIECEITTRSIDQHMVRLRQKVETDPANPRFLHTVHGAGYRFESGKK